MIFVALGTMITVADGPDRGTCREALLVFLAGFAVALGMVLWGFRTQSLVQDPVNGIDPYHFGAIGSSLARGEGFAAYGVVLNRRSPLYPFLIAGIYYFFGEHPFLVQLVQCACFAGTCALVYDAGRRVFTRRTGLIAAAASMLHPLLLRYVADLHLETLLTFVVTLMVWCSVRLYQRPSAGRAAAFGVAAGAATLTKAVVLLYPAVFLAAWWGISLRAHARTVRPRVALAAILALSMTAVILPWTWRNYRATHGRFVLVTTGVNDAFLRGLIFSKSDYALLRRPPYTDAENESNAWFRSLAAAEGTVWERDDLETEQILGREVRRQIRDAPDKVIRKIIVGLFTFWYEMTSRINSIITGACALITWVFVLIAVPRARREQRPLWLFVLPAVYLNLLLAVLLALGRYSAPVTPALLCAAAYGADGVLERLGWTRTP
jgi:4-amino-4-deoxy-L-arabinose transferase-like glycosyltransferase